MRRILSAAAAAAAASACRWVDEESARLDFDQDDIHVREDCNDRRDAVAFLEPLDGMIACGDTIDGDLATGVDALDVVNCLHPFSEGDLARVGWRERVYGFVSEPGADVLVELGTDQLLVAPVAEDSNSEVALLGFRGRRCRLEACELGLPLVPVEWWAGDGQPADVDQRVPWTPTLSFYAEPNELWHVIVSGGQPGSPPPTSPFQLRVSCGSDG